MNSRSDCCSTPIRPTEGHLAFKYTIQMHRLCKIVSDFRHHDLTRQFLGFTLALHADKTKKSIGIN